MPHYNSSLLTLSLRADAYFKCVLFSRVNVSKWFSHCWAWIMRILGTPTDVDWGKRGRKVGEGREGGTKLRCASGWLKTTLGLNFLSLVDFSHTVLINHLIFMCFFNFFLILINLIFILYCSRLPRWLSGKESASQCRSCRLDPWVRKMPWRRKWQPTPVFLPG